MITRPGTGLLAGLILAASITTTTLATTTREDTERADHCETITWHDDHTDPAAWQLAMSHGWYGLAHDGSETLYDPATCPLGG